MKDKIKINHQLDSGTAPFPITLYCMNTLDFLSAAFFGYSEKKNIKSQPDQTGRMVEFLAKYFKYDRVISEVTIDVFRHKLVHLAEPSSKGRIIGWSISSRTSEGDLWVIKEFNTKGNKAVYFGVYNFINDLRDSVLGSGDYYNDLSQHNNLQQNYIGFFKDVST